MSEPIAPYVLAHSDSAPADLVRRGDFPAIVEAAARRDGPAGVDDYFLAIGLRQLGRGLPRPELGRSASDLLEPLTREAPDPDVRDLAAIELVRAGLEADQRRTDLLARLESALPGYLARPNVAPHARLVKASILVRENRNAEAEDAIALGLREAEQLGADFLVAELRLALGRLRAWQGFAVPAERLLELAAAQWREAGNAVAVADAQYELGYLWADRRAFGRAARTLRDVVDVFEAHGVTGVKRARADNALLNALLGDGRADEVRERLARLDDGALSGFRLAMRLRDRARLEMLDAGATARAREYLDTAREALSDSRPNGFGNLSLDIADAQLRSREVTDAGARLAAADALARVGAAFSGVTRERPQEIVARLGAIDVYLDATESEEGSPRARAAARAAAVDQVVRLARAAASISVLLNDEAAVRVLRRADDALDTPGIRAAIRSLREPRVDEPLLLAMRQRDDEEAIELLARLADAIGQRHRSGEAPLFLTPSRVEVVEPGEPVILSVHGLPAETAEDRARLSPLEDPGFVAPERMRKRWSVGPSTDLYLIGAIVMARWFHTRPPNLGLGLRVQRGFWNLQWWFVTRGARGRRRQLARLAYELTALAPAFRPSTAQEVADRLRMAARAD